MLGSLFDKVTGLFDKRFVLALLLPAFAFAAGICALAATMTGWHQADTWWAGLDAARQVALGVAAAAAVVVLAIIIGTQVVAMTRLLEGYWRWRWVDATLGRLGRYRQEQRRKQLDLNSDLGYLHSYLAFPPDGAPQPTRLGNALRAAESYPGDKQRWGLDAAFWWPRLYLILPDSARGQVDDARASLDQLVVLTMLSAVFGVVALALSCHWLNLSVGVSCGIGALLLSRCSYLSAVTAAGVFGELVRSSYDLFRGDLLAKLGWPMPATLADERRLWTALSQQLYRRATDTRAEALLKAPRQPPPPPDRHPARPPSARHAPHTAGRATSPRLEPGGQAGSRGQGRGRPAGQVRGQVGERSADRHRGAPAGHLP